MALEPSDPVKNDENSVIDHREDESVCALFCCPLFCPASFALLRSRLSDANSCWRRSI